jgi:MoxR-like ATPase
MAKVKTATPKVGSPREKFVHAGKQLKASLIEREDEIELVLTALVASENVLLVGAPGTAKSMLLDSVMDWLGGRTFSVLLNKFTTPEEVFGPYSVKGLKEDKYVRITTGKLAEADGAFLDEVFKASSAILNTMLRILNERTFDCGDGIARRVPLKLVVAASNEWPQEENGQRELSALFDRFLLRKSVERVRGKKGVDRLWFGEVQAPEWDERLTPTELEQARTEAQTIPFTKDACDAVRELLHQLDKEGVRPGDRRQRKAAGVVRAAAWLAGHEEVKPSDLEVLAHILWDAPQEQPQKVAKIVGQVVNPEKSKLTAFIGQAEAIFLEATARTSDLMGVAQAAAKLEEVLKEIDKIGKSESVKAANYYVRDMLHQIKMAALGMGGT